MEKTKIKTKSTFEKIDNAIKHILSEKCKYTNCCTLYDQKSSTCNEDAGCFYGPGKLAGCAVELLKHGKNAYCYKEPTPELVKMKKRKDLKDISFKLTAMILLGVSLMVLTILLFILLIRYI